MFGGYPGFSCLRHVGGAAGCRCSANRKSFRDQADAGGPKSLRARAHPLGTSDIGLLANTRAGQPELGRQRPRISTTFAELPPDTPQNFNLSWVQHSPPSQVKSARSIRRPIGAPAGAYSKSSAHRRFRPKAAAPHFGASGARRRCADVAAFRRRRPIHPAALAATARATPPAGAPSSDHLLASHAERPAPEAAGATQHVEMASAIAVGRAMLRSRLPIGGPHPPGADST